MREAHCHIAAYGESLGIPDLSDCRSLSDCLDRVRTAAHTCPRGGWVRLAGARIESWTEARWPRIDELDQASPDHPCVIMSFDHHAAAANACAIGVAGLTGGQTVAPNGLVCADPHTNRPTGLLLEHAAYRVWGAAPEPSAAARTEHVRIALNRYAALGFTEIHDLHSQDWLGPALHTLQANNQLPVIVRLYPPVARLRELAAGRAAWESSRIRLAGGKLFADGTLNSRTALTLAPYREPLTGGGGGPCGRAMVTERELDEALNTTTSLGLHLAVHAIGDGAVRMVLDAWERHTKGSRDQGTKGSSGSDSIPRSLDPSIPSLRIEHAELIDAADIPRFAALGVTCSVQPCHLLTDIDVLTRQLPHRLDRVLPLRDLIDSGLVPGRDLYFGSDAPIVRPDPDDSILAATERRRRAAPQSQAIAWNQRITEAEAHACFHAR